MKAVTSLSILDNLDNLIYMQKYIEYSLLRPDGVELTEEQALGMGLIVNLINEGLTQVKQNVQTLALSH